MFSGMIIAHLHTFVNMLSRFFVVGAAIHSAPYASSEEKVWGYVTEMPFVPVGAGDPSRHASPAPTGTNGGSLCVKLIHVRLMRVGSNL